MSDEPHPEYRRGLEFGIEVGIHAGSRAERLLISRFLKKRFPEAAKLLADGTHDPIPRPTPAKDTNE